jgi:hypothetical protein
MPKMLECDLIFINLKINLIIKQKIKMLECDLIFINLNIDIIMLDYYNMNYFEWI